MPGVIPGSRRWKPDRVLGAASRPDREQRAQRHARRGGAGLDHRRGGLARGDDVNRRRAAKRGAHVGVVERTADEQTGVHAVDCGA